jgi:hypothetical protein
MLKLLPLALAITVTTGCAVAPQDGSQPQPMFGMLMKSQAVSAPAPAAAMVPAPSPRGDIRIMNNFKPGVSTVTDAVRALGAPSLVNHSPDGRFVYMYDFPTTPQGPMVAGMLFGPNQVLVKVDYFAKGK